MWFQILVGRRTPAGLRWLATWIAAGTKLPKSLPRSLKDAMNAGWDSDQFERVAISYLGSCLRAELVSGTNVDTSSLGSKRRRSTHVYAYREDEKRPVIKLPARELSEVFLQELSRDISDSEGAN